MITRFISLYASILIPGMRAINFIHPHILLVHVVMPVLFDLIVDWPALDRGIICRRSGMHPELTGCVPAPGPSMP
jgi:hypothetical protein